MTGNNAEKGSGAYEETPWERDAAAPEVVAGPGMGEDVEGGEGAGGTEGGDKR